jgi:hypothetical protein
MSGSVYRDVVIFDEACCFIANVLAGRAWFREVELALDEIHVYLTFACESSEPLTEIVGLVSPAISPRLTTDKMRLVMTDTSALMLSCFTRACLNTRPVRWPTTAAPVKGISQIERTVFPFSLKDCRKKLKSALYCIETVSYFLYHIPSSATGFFWVRREGVEGYEDTLGTVFNCRIDVAGDFPAVCKRPSLQ